MPSDDESTDLAGEYLAHALMNETGEYVARGRRFSATDIDMLRDQWVALFRRLLIDREAAAKTDFNDVGAEFRLRSVDPPHDRVQSEIAELKARIEAIGPDAESESRDQSIDEFLYERDKPKH
jgi:hypothetical protein